MQAFGGFGKLCPAQKGADAGEEFSQLKGLGDVVVSAAVQAPDDVQLFIGGGEKDDGNLTVSCPYPGAQIEAGAVGEGYIQKEKIVAVFSCKKGPGLGCGPGDIRGKAVLFQGILEAVNEAFIVLQE